jgi:telomerase protein component 1
MTRQWRTVRVFISSTFRDFHSERDLLTNHIFHELREWCERRFLHLVEIDLRWGVTQEESDNGKALQVCLDELDRSDFFLCLLGSRYGWMPEMYEVGSGSRFDWVRNLKPGTCSVTELEIKRAVLNPSHTRAVGITNAMFYIRDDSFLKEVPMDQLSEFTDGTFSKKGGSVTFTQHSAKKSKVQELREMVRRGAKDQPDGSLKVHVVDNYSCQYGGTTKLVGVGVAQPVLVGLERFHRQVLGDLKAAIAERYPITLQSSETKRSELAMNRELVNSYMERRVRNFQGRESEIEQVH